MLSNPEGIFSSEALLQAGEVSLKLLLGLILGGAIGWERERSGRPAGIRTHMLMCLGVVLISEVSKAFGGDDPSRIAAQIVAGVGFLGAGTIMRMGIEIRGLTTAASIWTAAAIGMAVSTGGAFYLVAFAATALALMTLILVAAIEQRLFSPARRELTVTAAGSEVLTPLVKALEAIGVQPESVRVLRQNGGVRLVLQLFGKPEGVLEAAGAVQGVESASWSE